MSVQLYCCQSSTRRWGTDWIIDGHFHLIVEVDKKTSVQDVTN